MDTDESDFDGLLRHRPLRTERAERNSNAALQRTKSETHVGNVTPSRTAVRPTWESVSSLNKTDQPSSKATERKKPLQRGRSHSPSRTNGRQTVASASKAAPVKRSKSASAASLAKTRRSPIKSNVQPKKSLIKSPNCSPSKRPLTSTPKAAAKVQKSPTKSPAKSPARKR